MTARTYKAIECDSNESLDCDDVIIGFRGETIPQLRKKLKELGWRFKRGEYDICPMCMTPEEVYEDQLNRKDAFLKTLHDVP